MAAFEVFLYGRFWVFTEATNTGQLYRRLTRSGYLAEKSCPQEMARRFIPIIRKRLFWISSAVFGASSDTVPAAAQSSFVGPWDQLESVLLWPRHGRSWQP